MANNIAKDYFSFDGTLDKKSYTTRFLTLFVIGIIFSFLVILIPLPSIILLLITVVRIIMAVATFSIVIRRLRDIGQSPWLSLILFIPLVNLAMLIYLCFAEPKAPLV